MSKIIRIFLNFFFIEEYNFRGMFFIIDIFWKLQFLNHFILFFFKGLVVGFGPKGMPDRMRNIVR